MKEDLQKKIKQIDTFIFDMDGTLVDLENLNFTNFKKVVEEELGITYSLKDYQIYMSGAGSHNGFTSFCNANGIISNIEKLVLKFREYKRNILNNSFYDVVKLKEGSLEFLQKAKKMGYKLGLATSSTEEFAKLVTKNFHIYSMFDVFLTAKSVKKKKPDPEIFNKSVELLNTTKEKSIIFEDSKNGIKGAKASGIYTIGIFTDGLNDEYVKECDFFIKSYYEIIDLI